MKKEPSFYAVIPATVRYDNELSSSEKLFYAEVTAMSQKEGYCWASNSYFAELYNVKNPTISMWVKSLKEKGHIVVEYERKGKEIVKRNIYPIQKIPNQVVRKSKEGSQKIETGWSENRKENITSINTINRIIVQGKAFDDTDLIFDVINETDLSLTPQSLEEKTALLCLHIWHDVNNLQPNNKTTLKAKLGTWYHPIRLMIEQDDRTIEEIWKLWKQIQRDEFWKSNILSPSKLREQFDNVSIKLKPKKQGISNDFINSLYE